MPTVTINRKVFEKLVGKSLPDDELKDRISMLGTDLESVSADEIVVEIFPNRPDMLSEQGFARAFSSFIGVKPGLRAYDVKKSSSKVLIDPSVKAIRPFTACAIVKSLKFNDERIREIIQIQEKLHVTYGRNRKKLAIGVYPLEKIKLPIKYFAADPDKIKFRPLEFPHEITALQILSQHPTGREYAHLLEGKELFPFFADASGNILSMPPIINSHLTGKVGEETSEVFIECSGFDFLTCKICLNIIVTAMADMGGEIYSMELEYPDGKKMTPDLEPRRIRLDVPYINKWLGLRLSEDEMVKLLQRMGYGFDTGFVLVPSYRADILHMVDLAEDVAIAYGYERFVPEIPNVATVGEESEFEVFRRKVADVLVGFGFLETFTYNLSNADDENLKMRTEFPLVELESAVNMEYNTPRARMLPSLMKVLYNNKSNDYPQNLFEAGNCFGLDSDTDTGVSESCRLALVLCGPDSDFTRIRQVLDCLSFALDIGCAYKEAEHPSFIPGRFAKVFINEKEIAYIGEIHPLVLESFDLHMPVAAFELDLTGIFGLLKKRG